MKLKLVLLCVSLFTCCICFAQTSTMVYYLKDSGALVSTKDSADYWMEVSPPDTGISKFLYVVREYGKNGKLRLQTTSKTNDLNLLYHGKYTAYYPDGKKKRTGEYVNGKFSGPETDYYPNGNIYNIKNYKIDRKVSFVECRDSAGKVLAQNGKGTWLEYGGGFKDTTAKGEIVNGMMNGKWAGKLNDSVGFENTYLNGNLTAHQYTYNYKPVPGLFTGKMDSFPTFTGGIEAFYKYLGKTLRYPVEARQNGEQGKVIIGFVVEVDGSLSNFMITKSVSAAIDGEALRVMKLSPKWTPALKDGLPVRVQYSVPINFAMSN